MLHRNLFLPFMALPASKPRSLDTDISPNISSQPPPLEDTTVGDINVPSEAASGAASPAPNSANRDLADMLDAPVSPSVVISPERSSLDPLTKPFSPAPRSQPELRPEKRPTRHRQKPRWQKMGNGCSDFFIYF